MTRFVLKDTEYYLETLPGFTSVGGAGFGTVQRNGVWQTVADGIPLIGDGGLLVPAARTQNYGYAGNLAASAVSFAQTNVVTTKGGLDILGGNGGARTVADAVSNIKATAPGNAADAVNYATGTTYTFEKWIYRPTTTVRYVQVTGAQAFFGTGQYVNVDLQTLAFTAAGGAASVTAFGSWVRICFAVSATADGASLGAIVAFIADLTAVRLPTTATSGIIDFAASQVKVGPDINDPPILQTTGLSATRTACSIGAPQATDTTAGTVIVEGMWLPNQGSGIRVIAEPGLAGNGGGFSLAADNLSPRAVFYGSTNEAVRFSGAGPAISPGASYKFGLSWSSSGVVASAQGATIARSGTAPQILFNPSHLLSLGSRGVGNSLHSNGLIRRVRWLPDYSDQAALNARTAL